jgi:NTP pyrophosphatase (non-canonical NTP hydrolase)
MGRDRARATGEVIDVHDDSQNLSFDDYQRQAAETDLDPDGTALVPLLGLGGEVGALLAEFKKKNRRDGVAYTGFDEGVLTELGDILWYLAALARRVGVPLGEVARQNLRKTRSRWHSEFSTAPMALDSGFPDAERLPRQFTVEFSSHDMLGRRVVRMRIGDDWVGDPIDDNARNPDGYRFHDAFHLAYAAVLGWSPILRALLKRKRKSDSAVDRAEDGARACATEEAIAALVFAMSKPYDFFEGAEHVDESILHSVTVVARGLEVDKRTRGEWERAILAGFEVWRALRAANGGMVRVDLDARELSVVS